MIEFSHSKSLRKGNRTIYMKLFLKLAWRNVWRNKRRGIITFLAIAFAVFLTVLMRGIQLGTYDYYIKAISGSYAGLIQIQKEGYLENPSLRKSFIYSDKLKEILTSNSDIIAYAPRLYAEVLISSGGKSYGGVIYGVDPSSELKFSEFHRRIKEGRFLNPDSMGEIVIGDKLFKNLQISIGDKIILLGQGFDGALWDMKFKVVGRIKLGYTELDNTVIFMNLKDAQEFLSCENRVTNILILLSSIDKIPSVKASLSQELKDYGLAVLSWEETMPEFKQSIDFDNATGILFLFFLIVIVAFGIFNTVSMSVLERSNEFGICLAIGFKNKDLVLIVLFEVIFIALIGILFGNFLGFLFNYYLVKNPINLGGKYIAVYEEFGFEPKFTSSLKPRIFINTTLSMLFISIVFSLFPLYKLYKLEPLKGIRFT